MMNKLLAILLSMLIVVGCVGCSKTENGKSTDESEAVELALQSYFSHYTTDFFDDFDTFFEKAKTYLTSDGSETKNLEVIAKNLDDLAVTFTNIGFSEDTAENFVTTIAYKIAQSTSYEIEEISIDNNMAQVKVKRTQPDFNTVVTNFNAKTSVLIHNLTEDNQEAINNIAPAVQKQYIINRLITAHYNDLEDSITDVTTDETTFVSTTLEFTLIKVDGKWLIDEIN